MMTAPDLATRQEFESGTWSITWRGRTWHESVVTGAHLAFMCLIDGEDTWGHLDMTDYRDASPMIGPGRAMSWIVTLVCVDDEISDPDEIAKVIHEVRATSVAALMGAVEWH